MDLSQQLDNAVMARDVQRVRDLLQPNNINLLAPENGHLLWLANSRRNIAIIELLIRAGANLAAADPFDEGASILHDLLRKATLEDDERAVEEYERLALLAIERGADVNARDDDGESVFQLAVQSPRQSVMLMQAMLGRGARVDNENFGDMLVDAAEGEEAAEALPMLVGLNDPSDEIRSQRAVTAIVALLQVPEQEFDFRAFEDMLSVVVDVNQPGSDGETMLVAAARQGKFAVVTVLLSRGADINRKTTDGVLPLHAASQSRNAVVTKLLIGLGADIHARNDDGKYPIHGACASRTVDNLHFLLSRGASLNVTDYSGKYPIHIARSNTSEKVMHLLLSIGTPINVIDVDGNTPFPLLNNWNHLHATTCLFIKRFALLHVTTGAVNEKDLTIIRANLKSSRFYDSCLNELRIMSEIVVFENFNWLSLLATSTSKLSAYLRNAEFFAAIRNSMQQHHHQFPTYFQQFLMTLKIAEKQCNIAQYMNNVLEQSFPVAIPSLAIHKITDYVLFEELIRSELNFYLSLYQRIDARGLDFLMTV